MTIRDGRIYLVYDEFCKTRNICATNLNCGHYVVPVLKGKKYFEHLMCPVCKKDTFVQSDDIYQDAEEVTL